MSVWLGSSLHRTRPFIVHKIREVVATVRAAVRIATQRINERQRVKWGKSTGYMRIVWNTLSHQTSSQAV